MKAAYQEQTLAYPGVRAGGAPGRVSDLTSTSVIGIERLMR